MKVEKLYVYPIKSFRGVDLDTAVLTKHGFLFDRQFSLLQVIDENGEKTFKNMSVANYNEMVRFFPEILIPEDGDASKGTIALTFKPIKGGKDTTLDIPLEPDTSNLEVIDMLMHKSPTKAWKMDQKYNDWLSDCFGYDVVLAYIGDNKREVRMSSYGHGKESGNANSWLSSISSMASKASEMVMGNKAPSIRFSDVAPYLIVSSKSMDDVHRRLPEGEQFDITKFRPNVIVSGAEKPWEEDFWAEITIGGEAKIECDHNCGRCRSINIDYDTGAQGTGEAGKMLKMLSSDRRVDKGTKWSPIFGRYSFLHPDSDGKAINVGDEVVVSRRNEEHTAFGMFKDVLDELHSIANARLDWKGLSTLPDGGRD